MLDCGISSFARKQLVFYKIERFDGPTELVLSSTLVSPDREHLKHLSASTELLFRIRDSARPPPNEGEIPFQIVGHTTLTTLEIDRNIAKLYKYHPNFGFTPQAESPGRIPVSYRSVPQIFLVTAAAFQCHLPLQ